MKKKPLVEWKEELPNLRLRELQGEAFGADLRLWEQDGGQWVWTVELIYRNKVLNTSGRTKTLHSAKTTAIHSAQEVAILLQRWNLLPAECKTCEVLKKVM